MVCLWQLAQRTTALPTGRGAFTLASAGPILTEALPVPKLVLAGRLPTQQNATVNLDVSAGQNLTDLTTWPEFHNGVAAGLRLAPGQVGSSHCWGLSLRGSEMISRRVRMCEWTGIVCFVSRETCRVLIGLSEALPFQTRSRPTAAAGITVKDPRAADPLLFFGFCLCSPQNLSFYPTRQAHSHPGLVQHPRNPDPLLYAASSFYLLLGPCLGTACSFLPAGQKDPRLQQLRPI